MSLKQKTFSGIKWTTYSTIVVVVIQLIQTAILARLLNPKDFGLMAIVMVVIGFSQAFIDMGISNAIIHKQEITKIQLSSLYWMNVISGIIVFVTICVAAPFIASFYSEPELTKLIIFVGITLVIQSFSQQFMVLWQKEMRFDEISKIEIINKIISFFVSVFLAFTGFGVYAIVYGTVAASIVSTFQYVILGFKEYRPLMIFKPSEIKDFVIFGFYQMGERVLNYFNFQIDTILIGKLLGTEVLGIYSIAKQLVMRSAQIFNPIITKVTFPAMAKIQNNLPKLKETYLKTINHLSSINFPIYAFLFLFAHDIILILFGNKWLNAVVILQILSIWAAIRSTGNPIGSLLLARGKANWGFWWNFAVFLISPLSIYIGSRFGIEGISYSLLILQIFLMPLNWYFLVRPLCNAKFIEYHKEIAIPALVSISSGFLVYVIINLVHISSLWINLLVGVFFGFIFVITFSYFFNKEFLNNLKEFIRL